MLTNNDVIDSRTLLHEAIPITGSIISGTYGGSSVALGSETNIKTYSHGQFQSVYDYPYLSSSANHIFDITCGIANSSALSSSTTSQLAKKINIYNQMAQILVGYDITGNVGRFDLDGTSPGTGDEANKMNEVFFLNFSRLLTKDEIKKGTFQLELGVNSDFDQLTAVQNRRILITDASGSTGYFKNSPAGEYGVLYATASAGSAVLAAALADDGVAQPGCGLIYYQAGIAVISGSVFMDAGDGGILNSTTTDSTELIDHGSPYTGYNALTASTIDTMSNAIRNRIYNTQFNNTTELNSAIYFCRANHNDFNYSSNPTYLTGSEIRVKEQSSDPPVTYITTVGLYSEDNELLAVAKLSEPIKKTPENELTLRVRLDY
tara:strand:+ start:1474 stop:2604 length:1131 start_codon:yes stop_codon:yes gene_type:complete